MNNEIILWDSPNGVKLPSFVKNENALEEVVNTYVIQLRTNEKSNIIKAYKNDIFDMPAEYIWNRTISIIKEKVLSFGNDFVLEMLDRSLDDSIDNISSNEFITLAYELGFINKLAKDKFFHANSLINYYQSRDAEEEMNDIDMFTIIHPCFQYILSINSSDFIIEFNNFRENLKKNYLDSHNPLLDTLVNSPYFYKKTTVRTLLNLTKETSGGEFEIVLSNMVHIFNRIWNSIMSTDKYTIGKAYAEAINNADKKLSVSLRRVLLSNEGFNYVPENLRSQSFIEYAKKLKSAHYGFDNFYNEVTPARDLANMGTIPPAAIAECFSAVLVSKLGNRYGVSNGAQAYLDKFFSELSIDRWEFYFNEVFKADNDVLYKLSKENNILPRWKEFIDSKEEVFTALKLKDKFAIQVIRLTKENKIQKLKEIVTEQYSNF